MISTPGIEGAIDAEHRTLEVNNLLMDVVPGKCFYKIVPEKDRVLVTLKKKEAIPWANLVSTR